MQGDKIAAAVQAIGFATMQLDMSVPEGMHFLAGNQRRSVVLIVLTRKGSGPHRSTEWSPVVRWKLAPYELPECNTRGRK